VLKVLKAESSTKNGISAAYKEYYGYDSKFVQELPYQ